MFLEYVQKYLLKVVTIVLQIVVIAMLFRFFIVSPAIVNGQSMENTLSDNDILLVNKAVYLSRAPERFEIVKARRPDNAEDIVKRVVGLPGERISIRGISIYVYDGEDEYRLVEPYAQGFADLFALDAEGEIVEPVEFSIPENHYFLVGDNREFSSDSREYGPLHRRYIEGKVSLVNRWPDWFAKE